MAVDVPYMPFREKQRHRKVATKFAKTPYQSVAKLPDGTQLIRPTDSSLESQMVNIAARNEILNAFRMNYLRLEREKAEAHLRSIADPHQKIAAESNVQQLKEEASKIAREADASSYVAWNLGRRRRNVPVRPGEGLLEQNTRVGVSGEPLQRLRRMVRPGEGLLDRYTKEAPRLAPAAASTTSADAAPRNQTQQSQTPKQKKEKKEKTHKHKH